VQGANQAALNLEQNLAQAAGQFDPGPTTEAEEPAEIQASETPEPKYDAPAHAQPATAEHSILSESTEADPPAARGTDAASAGASPEHDASSSQSIAQGVAQWTPEPTHAVLETFETHAEARDKSRDAAQPSPPAPTPQSTTDPEANEPADSHRDAHQSSPQNTQQDSADPVLHLLGGRDSAASTPPTNALPASMLGLSEKAYDYLARGLKVGACASTPGLDTPVHQHTTAHAHSAPSPPSSLCARSAAA
jgi:hypothetical protein